MNKSPVCTRLLYIDPKTGKHVRTDKKKFLKPEEAIKAANRLNAKDNVLHKVEAYKCTTCLRFHIGKTKKKKP
jgi:hypothetical protein